MKRRLVSSVLVIVCAALPLPLAVAARNNLNLLPGKASTAGS